MRHCVFLALGLLILQLASFTSLTVLGLPNSAYPWAIFMVLGHGFYALTSLSILIAASPFIVGRLYWQGGFKRWLSLASLFFLLLLTVSSLGGCALYAYWIDDNFVNLADGFLFLQNLNAEQLKLFISCQLMSSFVVFGLPVHYLINRVKPSSKVLGNAHFAHGYEIQQAGFFEKKAESILIGEKLGVPLYVSGFEHVLVFASSGSGKTRSIAIPNLFQYTDSIVCNDVKFTLFETTSGYREKVLGHRCYCFAPARKNGLTHRFNPLAMIAKNPLERITDIQRIAHILIPDNAKEPFWPKASRKLFKTLVLYVLDSPDHNASLGEISRLVKQENFDAWLSNQLDSTDHFDPEFYRNGYSYLNNPEKTRGNIVEEFTGYLELFEDPFIDAATSASDFDFRDLRRQKMTIYVGFSDDDMERLAPLLTLFWQQLISAMIQEIPDPVKEPYSLLCLIDEFSSLGRIERLRRSLKLLREYRVRCILMFQYIAQTYEKYSQDEAKAFINIKTKIAYAAEDHNDAELIAKMLGTRTQKIITQGVSMQHQGLSNSTNQSYQAIPLLRPEQIMRLSPNTSLIMRAGCFPVKAKQYIWYKKPAMKLLNRYPLSEIPYQQATRQAFVRSERENKEELAEIC